jgi:Mg/Co/Ni transporter MgtE
MRENSVGMGLVIGAALGGVVFALTSSVMWIVGGAALGLIVGSALRGHRDQSDSTKQNG